MTDNVQLDDVNVSSSPSIAQDFSVTSPSPEEMVPKSRVNDIVHQRTKAAYEKGRRETQAEYEARTTNYNQSVQANPSISSDMLAEIKSNVVNDLKREIEENNTKQYYDHVSKQFVQRIEAAKSKYPEIDKTLLSLNIGNRFPLVEMLTHVDNTAEMANHLGQNKHEVARLMMIARETPDLLPETLQQLSDSLKANQMAANQPREAEPLSQIKPSTTGLDSGSKTQRDWKRNPMLRG
jgi:hypothetical protein